MRGNYNGVKMVGVVQNLPSPMVVMQSVIPIVMPHAVVPLDIVVLLMNIVHAATALIIEVCQPASHCREPNK